MQKVISINLNGSRSSKETIHLELSLAGSGLTFEPGDSLGIVPENDPAMVEAVLRAAGIEGDDALGTRLAREFDITVLSRQVIEAYAALNPDPKLCDLLAGDAWRDYLEGRQIVEIPVDTSALAGRGTTYVSDSWSGFRPTTHTALALGLAVIMLLVGLGGLKRVTGFEPLASGFLLAASLLIAGGFLVSAARSVVPTTPAGTPRSLARSRSTRTRSSGFAFSRLVSMSATPFIFDIACISSREMRSSSSTSVPRTLIWIGFWPKGPASNRP